MSQSQYPSSFDHEALLASGRGELFGPGNAQLPAPPMLMFDRITQINGDGGEHGKGYVEAELDIHPDLWFFQCHFIGDPVMPGCLGLDAMWQLVGFYLGWIGGPGRGRALGVGEVKFTGQVQPDVKKVVYKIDLKRVINRRLVMGIADGVLEADGVPIYTATDMRVGLFGGGRRGRTRRRLTPLTIDRGQRGDWTEVKETPCGVSSSPDWASSPPSARARMRSPPRCATRGRASSRRPDHIKYGFRSQVWAPPSLGVTAEDWAPLVDRRAARFLANGTAWGHIAFEEALKDSGMTPEEIQRRPHRPDRRRGRALDPGHPAGRRNHDRKGLAQAHRAVRRAQGHGVRPLGRAGHLVPAASGINYSISSACATSRPLHRRGGRTDPWGKQDVVFAGGVRGHRLVDVQHVRRDGGHVVQLQRHAVGRQPRL